MRALKRLGPVAYGAAALALAVAATVAVVWPIWFFATRRTGLYTVACVAVGIAAIAASASQRRRGRPPGSRIGNSK